MEFTLPLTSCEDCTHPNTSFGFPSPSVSMEQHQEQYGFQFTTAVMKIHSRTLCSSVWPWAMGGAILNLGGATLLIARSNAHAHARFVNTFDVPPSLRAAAHTQATHRNASPCVVL